MGERGVRCSRRCLSCTTHARGRRVAHEAVAVARAPLWTFWDAAVFASPSTIARADPDVGADTVAAAHRALPSESRGHLARAAWPASHIDRATRHVLNLIHDQTVMLSPLTDSQTVLIGTRT